MMFVNKIVAVLKRNATLVATLVLTALAAIRPEPAARYYSTLSLPLIITLFACLGLSLDLNELRNATVALKVHASIQTFSLVATPWAFYAVCYKTGLARAVLGKFATGTMATACLPTTTNTNVIFTEQASGDVSVAAINAAVGNLMGALVAPLTAAATVGGSSAAGPSALFGLAVKIIAPFVCGIATQLLIKRRLTFLRSVSSYFLVAFLYLIFCDAFATGSSINPLSVFKLCVFMFLFHVLLLGTAWRLSGMVDPKPERRVAFVVCATQKTESLGVAIVSSLFDDDDDLADYTLPVVVYHTIQMFCAASLVPTLKRLVDNTGGDDDDVEDDIHGAKVPSTTPVVVNNGDPDNARPLLRTRDGNLDVVSNLDVESEHKAEGDVVV
ncbi:hypothetical protein CTAYLR_010564 [Chrysophaeum taylorii]|uniref:Uncharacterized protein n=1 Tax=Chrysophaeum taylorii TaxID=2483200 RepID=A0AAD7UIP1_9STRA|nr:hypothetical protein CTAYLR_010564 [Chrysophaeum taylorii]